MNPCTPLSPMALQPPPPPAPREEPPGGSWLPTLYPSSPTAAPSPPAEKAGINATTTAGSQAGRLRRAGALVTLGTTVISSGASGRASPLSSSGSFGGFSRQPLVLGGARHGTPWSTSLSASSAFSASSHASGENGCHGVLRVVALDACILEAMEKRDRESFAAASRYLQGQSQY